MTKALEKILNAESYAAPIHNSIDIYSSGTCVLYTPPPRPFPKIIQTPTGFVTPHPIRGLPLSDLHDTYKLDRYLNEYNGHTTAKTEDGKEIRVDHEKDEK